MGNRYSSIISNPYQGLPLDVILKAGMAKDANIQNDVDKNQALLDKIGGIETYGYLDTARKQMKLGELQSNIQKLGSKDFTNPDTQNEINGLIQNFVNDPEIIKWTTHAANMKESLNYLSDQQKSHKVNPAAWKDLWDKEEKYNSQDPNTTPSTNPLINPYYGLEKQDELGFYKDVKDLIGDSYQGIGTDELGNWYHSDGKSAGRLQQQVYNLLPSNLQEEYSYDYKYNVDKTKYPTFEKYLSEKLNNFANSAATENRKYFDNSGSTDGSSGNSYLQNNSGIVAPSLYLLDADMTTLTNELADTFLGKRDPNDYHNINSNGTILNFAKTDYGSNKSENDLNTINIAGELKNLEDKYSQNVGIKSNIDLIKTSKEFENAQKNPANKNLTNQEIINKLVKESEQKSKDEIQKQVINDPAYKELLKKAEILGIDINTAKKQADNLSEKDLLGIQLGKTISDLGDNIKFKVDPSEKNVITVDDNKFISGYATFTKPQLNQLFEQKGYTTEDRWYWTGKFQTDWEDVFLDPKGSGAGLIKPGTPDPVTGEPTYMIPMNKKIQMSKQILDEYDRNRTGDSVYGKNIQNFSNQRDEYLTNQSNNKSLQKLNSIKDTFTDPFTKKEIDKSWEQLNNIQDYKLKQIKIQQFEEILKSEKENPGTIKKLLESAPPTSTFKTKDGVDISNLNPTLNKAVTQLSNLFPGIVISSGEDSKHMKNSKHYEGKAIDIGANSSNKKDYDKMIAYLTANPEFKKQYGIEDIINEGDHIHIELI